MHRTIAALFCLSSFGAALAIVSACGTSKSADAPSDAGDAGPASVANGTIGAWQTLSPLPVPRANHCSVVANGYLVVIGGNYEPTGSTTFKNVAEIDVAKIGANGVLGPWQAGGKTPAGVNSCTAAASGNQILVLDGIYDEDANGNSPYEGVPQVATIGDDGTLTAFTPAGKLPTDVRILYSTALVQDGTLLTMFSRTTDDGDAVSLLSASVSAAGQLGTFREQQWLPGFRGHPEYAFAPPYIYAIGGYDATDAGNDVLATGEATLLDSNGNTGKPFPIASLPQPTSFGAGIAVDSWVFVVGGKSGVFSGNGSGAIYSGQMDSSGNITTWSTLAEMPEGRTSLSVAAGGDFIYVTGGGYKGGGLDTVFAAQVRFPQGR